MSQLGLIIKNEYLTDIKAKSFWIATFIVPILMVGFGGFAGYMMTSSDTAMSVADSLGPESSGELTPLKGLGLMSGLFLCLFIMMYGSNIFTKVKTEKTNRIVEILATCVPGRTMMFGKIISVGLMGITQLLLWGVLIAILIFGVYLVFPFEIPWDEILQFDYIMAVVWMILYFIGGYVFFGSLYACVGAMTDKNNENQEYMAVLTFILLISFYISEYAVDHGETLFVRVLTYIPFTSPTIGAVNAVTQSSPIWESLIGLAVLYVFAWLAMVFSGKIYTSSILLKGKRFTPKDLITFFKAK